MFALAWTTDFESIHLARDQFGEVPVHAGPVVGGYAFASELKGLAPYGIGNAELVEPGTVVTLNRSWAGKRRWYDLPTTTSLLDRDDAADYLRGLIAVGAKERAISDVPVCALLSGGIDSAAVLYHLRDHVPGIVAYTAVMDEKSRDLRCARETAEVLGVPLVEVPIDPPTSADLRDVVGAIEMPFKAQVEIGWACLSLAEQMAADGFKVTFSGEGSDELWASYGFAYHALDVKHEDWFQYRKNLFVGQHRKNFARCNKVFLTHGVECRLPFLHRELAEFAISLPRDVVQDGRSRPKDVIQRAYRGLLPDSIVNRPKLAFQDGLGLKDEAARAVSDPRRFYRSAFAELFSTSPGAHPARS